jgi:uncharacterized protein (TIGR03437 family)
MITAIENAATNIPSGLPNAAIAQGVLFVVKGKNLGPANAVVANAFPLSTSIGGTSVQLTVGGSTVAAIMYYSLAGQIAAILPSKTPVGTGTLIVTYNGPRNPERTRRSGSGSGVCGLSGPRLNRGRAGHGGSTALKVTP